MKYEVIVVGGGHAGCEASLATARLGHKTLLITGNIKNIADMPCNPSIGGPAKGIVVREIDALGGEMGRNADKATLQIKMLNTKKGPAVQALRAQADKVTYPKEMLKTLNSEENLEIKEAMVEDLIVTAGKIQGVILADGTKINSDAVILTTGTYLRSVVLTGSQKTPSGPKGEKESKYLSTKLKDLGLNMNYLGKQIEKQDNFNDKKFVITGTISFIGRDKLKEQINLYGGKTIDSVSKNTDVVIVGDNPGSKYEKAKELGITIWDEERLKEELNKINM